jgi:hypothetical protein
MPRHNRFRHQTYDVAPPKSPWCCLTAPPPLAPDTDEFRTQMSVAGRALRAASVRTVYLLHGTFVGEDSFGFLQQLRRMHKSAFDRLMGETGNYTPEFAATLSAAINRDAQSDEAISVRLFHWSSENHHLARADAAVRLLDELAGLPCSPHERMLLWAHSHGGNVLALLTNLLAAARPIRERFFRACHGLVQPWTMNAGHAARWQRVREQLDSGLAQRLPSLDVVTFGTPIRYGWDTGGCSRLLHFIYHRPRSDLPPYRTALPRNVDEILHAADGDYVQHWGIAGTNLTPNVFAWSSWLPELRLGRFLQRRVQSRDLLTHLQTGMRVPADGQTLLVDYGPMTDPPARHQAGHAIYTQSRWLAFHAGEVARRLYGEAAE